MRSFLFILTLLLFAFPGYTQQLERELTQQFETRFPSKEDKDLPRLRDFLESRDADYNKVRNELEGLRDLPLGDSSLYLQDKKLLQNFLEKKGNTTAVFDETMVDKTIQEICKVHHAVDSVVDENGRLKPRFDVDKAIRNVEYWLGEVHRKMLLERSQDNLNKDRDAAEKAIQSIYTVEKGNQEYKKTISLYYAIIIFALILISFYFLFRKSSAEIGNDFLNGNGLQFIALFAIIISTILFGILGILEGKELAAILSGIAGFILGKGLNVNLTRKDQKES